MLSTFLRAQPAPLFFRGPERQRCSTKGLGPETPAKCLLDQTPGSSERSTWPWFWASVLVSALSTFSSTPALALRPEPPPLMCYQLLILHHPRWCLVPLGCLRESCWVSLAQSSLPLTFPPSGFHLLTPPLAINPTSPCGWG